MISLRLMNINERAVDFKQHVVTFYQSVKLEILIFKDNVLELHSYIDSEETKSKKSAISKIKVFEHLLSFFREY